jgi:hypothetical protein
VKGSQVKNCVARFSSNNFEIQEPEIGAVVSLCKLTGDLKTWLRVVGASLAALTVPVALAWASVRTIKPQDRVYLVVGSVGVYVVAGFFVYLNKILEKETSPLAKEANQHSKAEPYKTKHSQDL